MRSPTVTFDHTKSTVTFIDDNMPSTVFWLSRPPSRWERLRWRAARMAGRLERWLTPL